jgi:phage terminase large subunit GpA-like protein
MTSLLLDDICRRALASLVPAPRRPLSDWLESNVRIPDGVTATPGPVRLWPYQRAIADAIGDPSIERVTLVKPVRVGFSTLLTGALANYVANEPSQILALLPTEADARDYVVSDIEPIFSASPALAGLLTGDHSEGGRDTLLSRRFPGGSLKIVAAKSPRNLRRHTVRILFIDEADAMLPGPEGSPISLAEKRTLSFADRKIVMGSTPLDAETSNVLRAYAQSDQRVFELACPDCGGLTEMLWKHIEWDAGEPETARFVCPHCEVRVPERFKAEMVARGDWRITRPEIKGHAGFRLNALVSGLPNASWAKLAAEFLRAKEDTDDLRVFVNTILAEGWRDDDGDDVDELALAARAEPFGLQPDAETGSLGMPAEVLTITAGVDVQDDRLEITLVGWSRSEALVLGHHIIWGTPDDDGTWLELEALLRTRWTHPLGGRLTVEAAVVDSGDGDWTERVYAFCFPRGARRIMAGKGMAGSRPDLEMSKNKAKGGRLWIIGVDGIKTTIMNRLVRGTAIRFSVSLEPVYFEQLTSERKITRYRQGTPIRRFERKPGARAEALDCLVYAFAARRALTISFDQREDELRGHVAPAPAPRVSRSKFVEDR